MASFCPQVHVAYPNITMTTMKQNLELILPLEIYIYMEVIYIK